jgi:hypothetical protein
MHRRLRAAAETGTDELGGLGVGGRVVLLYLLEVLS